MTDSASPVFLAWLESTGTTAKTSAAVRRAFNHWLMTRIAEDGLTTRDQLLEAAHRAVPASSVRDV